MQQSGSTGRFDINELPEMLECAVQCDDLVQLGQSQMEAQEVQEKAPVISQDQIQQGKVTRSQSSQTDVIEVEVEVAMEGPNKTVLSTT